MHRLNRMAFRNVTQMLLDGLTMLIAFVVTHAVLGAFETIPNHLSYVQMIFLYDAVLFLTLLAQDMYSRSNFNYTDRIVRNVFFSCLVAAIVTVAMLGIIKDIVFMDRFIGIYIIVNTTMMAIQWVVTAQLVAKQTTKLASYTLFVGSRDNIAEYLHFLGKTSFTYKLVGCIRINEEEFPKDMHVLGDLEDMKDILDREVVDEVVFAVSHTFVGKVEANMQMCESRGLTVKVAMEFNNLSSVKSCITAVGPIPVITYHTVSLNDMQLILKRGLDIVGALIGLLLTGIVSIFIIPAIKLDTRGPALFSQIRMGRNGRMFRMYKFRSMTSNAELMKTKLEEQNEVKDGMMFKMRNDPRVTRVGAFLRKTSLDELPQFINVLLGQMSLVGTRPPTMDEVAKYSQIQHRRISIKPGLTGLWQVSGRSSITDFNEVVKLDNMYIDNWSIWSDVSIIIRTIIMILFRKQSAW